MKSNIIIMKNKRFSASIVIMSFLMCISIDVSGQKIYKTTWKQSGIIIGGAVAMYGGGDLIERQRGPITVEDLAELNREMIFGIDQGAEDNFSSSAAQNSDYFKDGALIAPLTLFFSKQARENTKEILMMYGEVVSFNGGLTLFAKAAFGRYRPYAYNPEVDLDFKLQTTTRRSFFSGHVSQASSLSFFTATVFNDLYPDSKFRYLVWAGAIAAPAITSYLRVEAGRHFPTDVVVGYGVGALIGYFIPKLHKITQDTEISIIGAQGGLGLVYNF